MLHSTLSDLDPITSPMPVSALTEKATRFLFFTGKGGVGKTSLASATALALAEKGYKTLLVSTDPASNLDEALGTQLGAEPRLINGATGLFAVNIDPQEVAAAYREKVVGPMRGLLPEAALREMEEQLSGSCTMEIAAFDEFTSYLSKGGSASDFEHVIFDTAPTGHTLRLMALSQAWTTFLDANTSGNSCLGPLAGLEKQRALYAEAVDVLKDAALTRVILVSRAQTPALKEARRTHGELGQLGILNQCLVLNGWFEPVAKDDPIATRWSERQDKALASESDFIDSLPLYRTPLLPGNLVGLDAIRRLFIEAPSPAEDLPQMDFVDGCPELPGLDDLADLLLSKGRGVILTMGKGGVGKTTVAAALGLALSDRGAMVHLSTTDPAAHLQDALGDAKGNLIVDRIDPKAETQSYIDEVLATQGTEMSAESRALMEEDLRSPCTEEIAVFRAFARIVAKGRNGFVVLDTAPTGHTLLLLDATQSYHRELGRQTRKTTHPEEIENLLARLRDPEFTNVILVTIAEATPAHEAAALQEDLRRAGIEPLAWIINQSLAGAETADPILTARGQAEIRFINEVVDGNAGKNVYLLPWSVFDPVGETGLRSLAAHSTP